MNKICCTQANRLALGNLAAFITAKEALVPVALEVKRL